jgi:hypothetical protein
MSLFGAPPICGRLKATAWIATAIFRLRDVEKQEGDARRSSAPQCIAV